MKAEYINCDRCTKPLKVDDGTDSIIKYHNAWLCKQCAQIRAFDDDNPVMYPIYEP